MDFDWNNPPFNLNASLSLRDIEESFEDPFAAKLLPSSSRFSVQARYVNLGVSSSGAGMYSSSVKKIGSAGKSSPTATGST